VADRVVVPRSPLVALPDKVEAVVAYAKAHPREGYRRLAWMMVDEDVAYLTPSTVYRILDRYDLLYRWKRPEPGQGRRVPEATYPDERCRSLDPTKGAEIFKRLSLATLRIW